MRALTMVTALVLLSCCGRAQPAPRAVLDLPEPSTSSETSLEEAIAQRRSVREFTGRALGLGELSQLLWSVQGITSAAGYRAAPSAGALYPLEIYVVIPDGTYHYVPSEHTLALVRGGDARRALAEASLGQQPVVDAAAVVVVTAVYARTEQKYGDRSERYVHLEAGHAAQNLLLQATGLGLGAVPVGAFVDEDVQRVLDLPDDHAPLYVIPVGEPAAGT